MGVVLPQPIEFGKYTLFERIGRGGMADVFKGRVQGPAGFERVFVVKRILPHLCDDPQFTKMFIEEAKLSARLNHPNIVQVFELGSVESEYFIAMEYVKGRDLSETMRTIWARIGPPRPELVAYIGREMCRALAYAHDLTSDDGAPLGMIHRDVSPSNVMLSYEGAVKLLDFGIAKALGGEKEESGTQRGTLKGKFAYMAPEQTQGSDVDKRIDIFATGIVLHEVLTGRRLFKGENDLQTVEKVRQCDVPPPSVQNPLCPPELDAIILKALSKNRDDRFLTASDMADALDDVVHAARFQPTHLAQLMRDLFPTDAGAGVTGTQRAVSQSLSGSSSRPHSVAMRSPTTVPPVSVSRSSASMYKITPVPPPEAPPVPPPPPPTPVYKRGAFWGALFAVGAAFGGGVLYTRSQAPARVAGPREDRPRSIGKQQVLIQSLPDGAQILEYGTNKELGVTPKWLTFDFDKGPVRVVLRKTGFQDTERDVKAHVPLMVYLPQVNNPQPGRKGTPTDKPAADKPSGSDKPAGSDKGSGTDKGDKGSTAVPPGPSEAPPSSKPSSPSRPSATGARPSAPAPSAPSASAPPPKPAAPDPAPTAGTTPRPAPAATPPKPKKSVNDIVDPF